MLKDLGNINKLLDVIEDLVAREDTVDPEGSDKLLTIADRLESLAMEIKDKNEAP